jgi:hypothetical protein
MPTVVKPAVRFFHSAGLQEPTNAVLARTERDDDATKRASALSSVVVELTESGSSAGSCRVQTPRSCVALPGTSGT